VKSRPNGNYIRPPAPRGEWQRWTNLDIQISLDGSDAATKAAARREWARSAGARRAMDNLERQGAGPVQDSVRRDRHNATNRPVKELAATGTEPAADHRGCAERTRARQLADLPPDHAQQRQIYEWLLSQGRHLMDRATRSSIQCVGGKSCRASKWRCRTVVCLIRPRRRCVYECPFVIHDQFKAGSCATSAGSPRFGKHSDLFLELRTPQSAGGACASCGSYDRVLSGGGQADKSQRPGRSTAGTGVRQRRGSRQLAQCGSSDPASIAGPLATVERCRVGVADGDADETFASPKTKFERVRLKGSSLQSRSSPLAYLLRHWFLVL